MQPTANKSLHLGRRLEAHGRGLLAVNVDELWRQRVERRLQLWVEGDAREQLGADGRLEDWPAAVVVEAAVEKAEAQVTVPVLVLPVLVIEGPHGLLDVVLRRLDTST